VLLRLRRRPVVDGPLRGEPGPAQRRDVQRAVEDGLAAALGGAV